MPKYPAQLDNSTSLPAVVDNFTPVTGAVYNRLRDAVIAVEQELGVKPSGTVYNTVRARLDTLETILNNLNIDAIFGGDLESTDITTQQVVGILGYPIYHNDITISNNYVLKFVNSQWMPIQLTMDDILPPFLVTLTSSETYFEVGQLVLYPFFTATYNYSPLSYATISDTDGYSQDVILSPEAFDSNYSYIKSVFGDMVTFTLAATYNSSVTKTASIDFIWGQKLYWGIGLPGETGASFIKSLSDSLVSTTIDVNFTINAPDGYKVYFAHRTDYGTATFTVGGFDGGFTQVETVDVTNDYTYTESYTLYESDNAGLGITTITVS